MKVAVTSYLVKVGDGTRVTFLDKKKAFWYRGRCGSAKVITIPPTR